jgi:hypothetical protein
MNSIKKTYTDLVPIGINNIGSTISGFDTLSTNSNFFDVYNSSADKKFVFDEDFNIEKYLTITSLTGTDNYHTLFILALNNDWKNIIRFKFINLYGNISNISEQNKNFVIGNRLLLTDHLLQKKKESKEIYKSYILREWNALMAALYYFKINLNLINQEFYQKVNFVFTIINLLFDLNKTNNNPDINPDINIIDNNFKLLRLYGSSNLSLTCKLPEKLTYLGQLQTMNTTPFHMIVIKAIDEIRNYYDNISIDYPYLYLLKIILDNIKKVNIEINEMDDWGITPIYLLCYTYAYDYSEPNDKEKRELLLKLINKMIINGANPFIDTFISSKKYLNWNKNGKLSSKFLQRPFDLILERINIRLRSGENPSRNDEEIKLILEFKKTLTNNMNKILENKGNSENIKILKEPQSQSQSQSLIQPPPAPLT